MMISFKCAKAKTTSKLCKSPQRKARVEWIPHESGLGQASVDARQTESGDFVRKYCEMASRTKGAFSLALELAGIRRLGVRGSRCVRCHRDGHGGLCEDPSNHRPVTRSQCKLGPQAAGHMHLTAAAADDGRPVQMLEFGALVLLLHPSEISRSAPLAAGNKCTETKKGNKVELRAMIVPPPLPVPIFAILHQAGHRATERAPTTCPPNPGATSAPPAVTTHQPALAPHLPGAPSG